MKNTETERGKLEAALIWRIKHSIYIFLIIFYDNNALIWDYNRKKIFTVIY